MAAWLIAGIGIVYLIVAVDLFVRGDWNLRDSLLLGLNPSSQRWTRCWSRLKSSWTELPRKVNDLRQDDKNCGVRTGVDLVNYA